jgi:hypothetical protein
MAKKNRAFNKTNLTRLPLKQDYVLLELWKKVSRLSLILAFLTYGEAESVVD